MSGEVVQVVEGMLGSSNQVLGILGRYKGFDGDGQREDWLADLAGIRRLLEHDKAATDLPIRPIGH